MIFRLHKCSLPNDWDRDFQSMDDVVTELRKHICRDCLDGSPGMFDDVVDVDGIECRDVNTLLSTPCGLEFDVEEIEAAA